MQVVEAKLLAAAPAARSVVEISAVQGGLAQAYVAAHPGAEWTRIDVAGHAGLRGPHDLVVVNDALGRFPDPVAGLSALAPHLTPDALLVMSLTNSAGLQGLSQMLMGDLTPWTGGPVDAARPRPLSQASAFKILLDAGWLPSVSEVLTTSAGGDPLIDALTEAAGRLGASAGTAQRNLGASHFIVAARRWPKHQAPGLPGKVSVVVPVNRPMQMHLNVLASPGLAEIDVEVIPVSGARSAAEALEKGRSRASGEWIVFCHQDIYFPAGTGRALSRAFAQTRKESLIGFAGMAADARGPARPAGLVVDRIQTFDHPATEQAVSVDELAVALHRDSAHVIDPAMGWHLWGTDLVLSSAAPTRIVRVPLFHNSLTDFTLPSEFQASADYLRRKHPNAGRIDSLCVSIPA